MDRRNLLRGGALAGSAGVLGVMEATAGDDGPDASRSAGWGEQEPAVPYTDYTVHRVSKDGTAEFERIQAAVNAAEKRDLVLVEPGVYYERVAVNEPAQLTIRGTDRDEVIIDGEYGGYSGIAITADDVVVENLTVRHCTYGVYWTGVEGYRGSHLVTYNNTGEYTTGYGIYAYDSRYGRFEHSYASGTDDAGFYIGESQPADAVVTNCLAENNAMGYSGTNAGGNLVIRDSEWRNNMSGLVPNTLDSEAGAPQGHVDGGIRIEGNEIHHNNNLTAPGYPLAYPPFGNGITIAGGTNNDVVDNDVHHQEKYGIAVTPILDQEFYRPKRNAVERNTVRGSGRADLALAAPADANSFSNNDFDTSRPAMIEQRDDSMGDAWVFLQLFKEYAQTEYGDSYHSGRVKEQPVPDEETLAELRTMEDPANQPPRSPIGGRA
jgi:hypothetical protein